MPKFENDDEVLLLDNQKVKKRSNYEIVKNVTIVMISAISLVIATLFVSSKLSNEYGNGQCSSNAMNITNSTIEIKNDLPYGFVFLDENDDHSPLTVDREKDDGTKLNLYDFIHPEDLSFYYDEEKFESLKEVINIKNSNYFCEYGTGAPPEAYEGYEITCPAHYTIALDMVFYGRHKGDKKHCTKYYEGNDVEDEYITVDEECGNEPIDTVKEICEGRTYCSLRPGGSHFADSCQGKFKYLHVDYHCIKDKKLKKERISIVMYSNVIKPNSIYENAISSFYQYSKIHGYDFEYNHYRYDTERQIFFMKLNSVLEKIIIGLKEKKYDWIFWADSDVILANPNIRIEAFLPNDKMSNVHFIGSDDVNGLNAGVFLIRVHPWSLNLIMRAMSYSYFNKKKGLKYADQSSLNNVLTESIEDDSHFIIVPQNWFNSYIGLNKDGDFLLHLAGHVNKDDEAKIFRYHISSDEKWYTKTSKEMREEVLEYYALPKNKQHKIKVERR